MAENVNNYRDSLGNIWFIGEVSNKGQTEAGGIQIAVSLLDASGQTIASGSDASPAVPILKPGEKTLWKMLMNNKPEGWASERVQVQAGPVPSYTRQSTYADLKVDGLTLTPPENQYSWVKATGQITNTGNSTAKLVKVTLGLYDQTGKLIAVDEGYSQLQEIPAGGSAPFAVNFLGTKQVPPRYEVYVTGSK